LRKKKLWEGAARKQERGKGGEGLDCWGPGSREEEREIRRGKPKGDNRGLLFSKELMGVAPA